MVNKEKRPAEMETPTGTLQITLPDYNTFSPVEQEKAVKIMELFWMALQINGVEDKDEQMVKVFPWYFGNTNTFDISADSKGLVERKNIRAYKEMEEFIVDYKEAFTWLKSILERIKHEE